MNSANNNVTQRMNRLFSNLVKKHTGLLFLITSLMLFGMGIYGLVVSINYGCGNIDPSKYPAGVPASPNGVLCGHVNNVKNGPPDEPFCMQAGLMTCSIFSIIIGIAMAYFAYRYMTKA